MKKYVHFIVAIVCIAGLTDCRGKKPDEQETKKQAEEVNKEKFVKKADEKEAQFLVDMVAGNNAEIEMSEVAIKRSKNDELKQVADMMKKDHSFFLNGLKKMAGEKDVSIPAELAPEVQAQLKKMEEVKDTAFDRTWCEALLDKHKKAIPKLEATLISMTDEDIRKWIEDILPIARTHLDKLMAIHYKLK